MFPPMKSMAEHSDATVRLHYVCQFQRTAVCDRARMQVARTAEAVQQLTHHLHVDEPGGAQIQKLIAPLDRGRVHSFADLLLH